MSGVAMVTGSGGLVGSEAVSHLAPHFEQVVGIDNNMRRHFFGEGASTAANVQRLLRTLDNYRHVAADIRDEKEMARLFAAFGSDIRLIIHTAAQPSHDWAAGDPVMDFTINANGTLTLLEMTRRHAPQAVFIHCSTNKVYGDAPNFLPLVELETRFEVSSDHAYHAHGIDETMGIDQSKHSLFGVSKAASDLMVQEYGRYFGMHTACFRGGCLTGPLHAGARLHGFLHYLMQCAVTGGPYTIYGYKGKQVRDNLHAADLVNMFWHFYQDPRSGEVYNVGGSRHANCSMLEAIGLCEEITGKKMRCSYTDENRIGDHIWWISDIRKFQSHYPNWRYRYGLKEILVQIYERITDGRSADSGPC
jgi:CDP-paratose 2-epimerase